MSSQAESTALSVSAAPTAAWYGLLWFVPATVCIVGGLLLVWAAGADGVGVLALSFVAYGALIVAVMIRACTSRTTLLVTADHVTVHSPAYFRGPVVIPRHQIMGCYYGTRPLLGSASSRHAALVLSFPRTNLGIRFNEDSVLPQARPAWSAVLNNLFLRPRGNSTLVPAHRVPVRGLLVHVTNPEHTARELAKTLGVDTGQVW